MKIHEYNEMMSYLVRRENFADGTPPPKKPYSAVEFKNSTDTLLQGVYGTGKSSNAFLVDLMQKELDKAVTEGVVTMQEGLEFIKSRKKYYDDYLKEKSNREKYDGFTFFKNNLANYLYTHASFSSYITSSFYEDGSFEDWFKEAYKNKGLFKALHEKGYQIRLHFVKKNI